MINTLVRSNVGARRSIPLALVGGAAAALLAATVAAGQDRPKAAKGEGAGEARTGQAFQTPYRLTETNHFLVRVRINGKGPFNFLVDSGAPALYVATETAAKVGLKPPAKGFWTPVDRLEIEGGASLEKVKARVEDPFQLVGMNALGLPGATIDGVLGFTILARFRLEIDPTSDRMTWTRLDFAPPDPPVPADDDGPPPVGMQLMNALGPVAKGLAFLMGKQPEEVRLNRGFLGIVWAEAEAEAAGGPKAVRVVRTLPGSPAEAGGLRPGDVLRTIDGKPVDGVESARALTAGIRPGDSVAVVVERAGAETTLKLTAGEGL